MGTLQVRRSYVPSTHLDATLGWLGGRHRSTLGPPDTRASAGAREPARAGVAADATQ
jgi:hypothetical protein